MAKGQASKSSKELNYFNKHKDILKKQLSEYKQNRVQENFFSQSDYAIFNTIEKGITQHPLREYQMEALYLMDYLLKCADSRPEKKDLIDVVNKEENTKAPYLSFEMATGSGKTMLMGASIYVLCKKFGIDNFLIITPASTDIYQKTIRNFEKGNRESVWADDTPFSFNIITGENYTQNLLYKTEHDANIFIFNIAKFSENAKNTEKTWESAIWKDAKGNSISVKEYLRGKKLAIITDEAHHAQTPKAVNIIKKFVPNVVLEFTATAVGDNKSNKKPQNIAYKYDIKRFLADGYGKLVRAVALDVDIKKDKNELQEGEKQKLVTFFLIHLLKKEAVLQDPKGRSIKPIGFVKVKNETTYTQKVYDYIRTELWQDKRNIEIVVSKLAQQELEITRLLQEMFQKTYNENIASLCKAIKQAAETAIFYYGNSDKETERKFRHIRNNEVEIVVYMQRLDEGIDLPNIFTMAVINDNDSDLKTSVKQIIGRGVRLYKDKREFDDETNLLKANAEKLHIVCDRGKNFEDIIMAIQKEFGLNDKYLSIDQKRIPIRNTVKESLLKGKYLPHIKADYRVKPNVSLLGLVEDTVNVINHFVEDNCFAGLEEAQRRFLKYRPDGFFSEIDIFSDYKVYHKALEDRGGTPTSLTISEKDARSVYGMIQKRLLCLPDIERVRQCFLAYAAQLNEIGLQYYKIVEADEKLAKNLFVNSFCSFYQNYIEKRYFDLQFQQLDTADSWNLYQQFQSYEIRIPEDQEKNNTRKKGKDKDKLIELIQSNYFFFGFEKSVYDYDKFDSYTEYQLVDYLDKVLVAKETKGNKTIPFAPTPTMRQAAEAAAPFETKVFDNPDLHFWIRNERNVYFSYGTKKYYPDFILFRKGIIYVLETKGDIFADTKKNMLLLALNEVKGDSHILGYKGVIIFSNFMNEIEKKGISFDEFIAEAEAAFNRHQSLTNIDLDVPKEKQYVSHIPVFKPEKAKRYFLGTKEKSPKPDGWLLVPERAEKYPATVFAMQAKGSALAPKYLDNEWVVLNNDIEMEEIENKIALIYHESVHDAAYEEGYTLRKVNIELPKRKKQLFPEITVHLNALNEDIPPISIENITNNAEIDFIGVEYVIES